jgi:hypothetical protein
MPNARLLVRAAVALSLAAATPPAGADELRCAERTRVVQKLLERVVELYSSETTGTWTILVTRPDGISCLLAAGQLWEQVAPVVAPGSDA